MNYTSIEQSKKLLELGLSPESADMHTEMFEENGDMISLVVGGKGDNSKRNYGTPIWSIGALLEVMPNIELFKLDSKYIVGKLDENLNESAWHDTPLEAAYNMVVWLLENNYIKQ